MLKQGYPKVIDATMKKFFEMLSEKDLRPFPPSIIIKDKVF